MGRTAKRRVYLHNHNHYTCDFCFCRRMLDSLGSSFCSQQLRGRNTWIGLPAQQSRLARKCRFIQSTSIVNCVFYVQCAVLQTWVARARRQTSDAYEDSARARSTALRCCFVKL